MAGQACGGVLVIGNFDGVHLGHQRLLREAGELARPSRLPVVALTFEPPPDRVTHPQDRPERITPADEKCRLLLDGGADYVVVLTADRELLSKTPEQFIDEVLRDRLGPRFIVEGEDFRFGRHRAGDVHTLRRAGFEVRIAQPVVLELDNAPKRVSSTLVRDLLRSGAVEQAARCLGRPFVLYGTVVGGHGRGRLLEFPTANVGGGEQICPADGVYAGRAAVAGIDCPAAISIGVKPTFGPSERTVEAFLLDAEGDFYHKPAALSFLRYLRPQETFETAAALKDQIAKDVQRVRELTSASA